MQRIKSWALWWMMFSTAFYHTANTDTCSTTDNVNWNGAHDAVVNAIKALEEFYKNLQVYGSLLECEYISFYLHKPGDNFEGFNFSVSNKEVTVNNNLLNSLVSVRLPKEMDVGKENTIVFSMIQLPHKETMRPDCVFLNTTTKNFSGDGCLTLWERNQSHVTCSCDHLTYFGVLLVSVTSPTFTSNGNISNGYDISYGYGSISPKDAEILSYITYIGCGISLFALVITVLLFIINRKLREDDSKKIHICLVVALILLNVHFLPSQMVAALSSTELCLYVALLIHFSLLASFTWMALEGFHLYLLLVKVFNIYVKRYLLKLSVVGWGLPAVIVSVVVIIDKDIYGRSPLDSSNPNGTAVCYITNDDVKLGTTVGLFSFVFLFNLILFGITVKWFLDSHASKERGWSGLKKAKPEIVTLLLLLVLLGLTWGLIFLSFGHLTTPALYIFCILNPLQGFFIFIYFVLSLKKTKDSSSETHNT